MGADLSGVVGNENDVFRLLCQDDAGGEQNEAHGQEGRSGRMVSTVWFAKGVRPILHDRRLRSNRKIPIYAGAALALANATPLASVPTPASTAMTTATVPATSASARP